MNSNFRNLALWAIIAVLLIALFNLFQSPVQRSASLEVPYSKFLRDVENNKVRSVVIAGREITGVYGENGAKFETYSPEDPGLIQKLEARGVQIEATPPNDGSSLTSIFLSWLPMFVLLGVWIFFMRQMQGSSGKAMGFGKSKAKLLNEEQGRVTFDEVAGVDEAKQDLEEIVDFLRDPQKYQRLGGKIQIGRASCRERV